LRRLTREQQVEYARSADHVLLAMVPVTVLVLTLLLLGCYHQHFSDATYPSTAHCLLAGALGVALAVSGRRVHVELHRAGMTGPTPSCAEVYHTGFQWISNQPYTFLSIIGYLSIAVFDVSVGQTLSTCVAFGCTHCIILLLRRSTFCNNTYTMVGRQAYTSTCTNNRTPAPSTGGATGDASAHPVHTSATTSGAPGSNGPPSGNDGEVNSSRVGNDGAVGSSRTHRRRSSRSRHRRHRRHGKQRSSPESNSGSNHRSSAHQGSGFGSDTTDSSCLSEDGSDQESYPRDSTKELIYSTLAKQGQRLAVARPLLGCVVLAMLLQTCTAQGLSHNSDSNRSVLNANVSGTASRSLPTTWGTRGAIWTAYALAFTF
jgi:hypothetical protein